MSDGPSDTDQRQEILDSVLSRSDALFAAAASDGVLVPLPASLQVPPDKVLGSADDRTTLLHAVLPEDRMAVVTAWERSRSQGLGVGQVRLASAPQERLSLTFLDVVADHGVVLVRLMPQDDADADAPGTRPGAVAVSRLPRTASMTKSVIAVITDVDPRVARMLGWTREQMVGTRALDFIHPEDHERAIANWMELLAEQESHRVRLRHSRADGSYAWLELENTYHPADDPADAVVTTQLNDVSDEMAVHEALAQQERLLRRLTESLPLGIAQLDVDGHLVHANSRRARMRGGDVVPERPVEQVDVPPAVREAVQEALDHSARTAQDTTLEVTLPHPTGAGSLVYAVTVVPLGASEGQPGSLLCVADVTDGVRLRDELTVRATYDALTGCHNRASALAALDQALTATAGTAVVFVDLARFKPVNDRWGHGVGDELLVQVAERLTGVLRHHDLVGRIGGDEFLVVSRGVDTVANAQALGRRVQEALAAPAHLSVGPVDLRASIGVALALPGEQADQLVTRADRAMYASKQELRGEPVLAPPG